MRKKTFAVAALLAAATLTLSACGSGSGNSDGSPVAVVSEESSQSHVTVLDQPFTKPDLVLTDTAGKSYDLREETKGRPTLIYFGYTNCPDVCPLTMNNIAVAKKQLSKADQDALRIVFVTTDPDRDTPAALGKWLKGIDPEVVGLTGEFDTIQAAARSTRVQERWKPSDVREAEAQARAGRDGHRRTALRLVRPPEGRDPGGVRRVQPQDRPLREGPP